MDLSSILPNWLEKLISARARQKANDLRIADKALQLRRQLLSSFEDYHGDPKTQDELTGWAAKLSNGFRHTEPGLRALVDLRPEASNHVQQAIGDARDHFDAAADIINLLFKGNGLSINDDNRQDVITKLGAAVRHARDCIKALQAAQKE